MPRGWRKAKRANDFNGTSRYFGQACQSARTRITNNLGWGHISLRPTGTSPTLGEDYLLAFQGRHASLPKTFSTL